MRRVSDTLSAGDHPLHPDAASLLDRRVARVAPPGPRSARAGWGFIFPVLVVCAGLLFLLSGNPLI